MAKYGLLIDLDRCVGCRSHEIVCKGENNNELVRQPLVIVTRTTKEGKTVMNYLHFVQARCSNSKLCAQRVGQGLDPRCIAACTAQARKFGKIEELTEYIRSSKIPHAHIIPF